VNDANCVVTDDTKVLHRDGATSRASRHAIERSWVWLPDGHCYTTASGKLFTPHVLCIITWHQWKHGEGT